MSWARLDDNIAHHPKILCAGLKRRSSGSSVSRTPSDFLPTATSLTPRLAPSAAGPRLAPGNWPRSSCRCVCLNDARTATRSTTSWTTTNPPPSLERSATLRAARAAKPAARAAWPPASRGVHRPGKRSRPSKHMVQSRRRPNQTRRKRCNESFTRAKQTGSKGSALVLRLCVNQTKPYPGGCPSDC